MPNAEAAKLNAELRQAIDWLRKHGQPSTRNIIDVMDRAAFALDDLSGDMLRPVSRALRDDMSLLGTLADGRLTGTFDRQLWNDWAEAIGDLASPSNPTPSP
jgi:hypothetical protein